MRRIFQAGSFKIAAILLSFFILLAVGILLFFFYSQREMLDNISAKSVEEVQTIIEKNKQDELRKVSVYTKERAKWVADTSVRFLKSLDYTSMKNTASLISSSRYIVGLSIYDSVSDMPFFAYNKSSDGIEYSVVLPKKFVALGFKYEQVNIMENGVKIGEVKLYFSDEAILKSYESDKVEAAKKLEQIGKRLKADGSEIFNKQFLILLSALISISACVVYLGVIFYRRNEDQNSSMYKKNIELTIAIDSLRKTQRQLVESEKLASLGALVSGVSHEINNPVGIALTAVTSLKSRTDRLSKKIDDESVQNEDIVGFITYTNEAVDIAHRNLKLTAELVKSFKDISADQQSGQKREINFKSYLEEIFTSLSPEFKQKRHTYKIICDDDLMITTYPGAWFQILANLVVNSIKHGFADRDQGVICFEVAKRTENTMQIVYYDDGVGIKEELIPKIFDPFFTTNRGQGSGLGMNIVYSLITQKLKGIITATNDENGGAKFVITVPTKI